MTAKERHQVLGAIAALECAKAACNARPTAYAFGIAVDIEAMLIELRGRVAKSR